jgi:hypothetical protein
LPLLAVGFDSGKQWQTDLGGRIHRSLLSDRIVSRDKWKRVFAVYVRWVVFPITVTT